MRFIMTVAICLVTYCSSVSAQDSRTALTIYNQEFAVVRQSIELALQRGISKIRFTDTTAHLEPDSVILRDPLGEWDLRILEQNYRADPVSQALLLSLYEGQTIDFLVGNDQTVTGKIIRSGYVPHQAGLRRYGNEYYATQMARSDGGAGQPIIETGGKLRFGLPGIPLFPGLADDTILKPTLNWLIASERAGQLKAELGYVTGGMAWEADYNLVAPETGDLLDLVGWITMDNQSGKTFSEAYIKLMAGDVRKIQPGQYDAAGARAVAMEMSQMAPPVSEKAFDEYHLYTLQRPTTLRDRETKQVEFIRAAGIQSQRLYIYDGVKIPPNLYRGYSAANQIQDENFGIEFNPKVSVMREFSNSKDNQLGLPLPRGRVRFYRQDEDGQLEFTGENMIDHTPRDETIRLNTGSAFDLTGERIRTSYKIDTRGHWLDESFEIKLRNHKEERVEIRVIEHLYRWSNWQILEQSAEYSKLDSRTIEFRLPVQPDQEETLIYTVHYSW